MASGWRIRVKALWRSSSALDRLATLVIVLYVVFWMLLVLGWPLPVKEPPFGADLLSVFFGFAAVVFLLVRGRRWMGSRLLWSVRNRLILAYIFIAFVPIVLLLAMGGILTYMAEVEVAAHLLHEDMNSRMQEVAAVSREALSMARITAPPGIDLESLDNSEPVQDLVSLSSRRLPGLTIRFLPATAKSVTAAAAAAGEDGKLAEQDGRLWIEGASVGELSGSRWVEAVARLPVTSRFLDGLSSEFGPITFGRPLNESASRIPKGSFGELLGPNATASITSRGRSLAPSRNPLDIAIVGATTFDALRYAGPGAQPVHANLVVTFATRASSMGDRIEQSLGEFASFYVILLGVVTGLFVVLWLLALIAGMVLTLKITRMMAKLDDATHHIKGRDFSHRISIVQRDQLGALANSFNSMTASIEGLLDEQRQRQRLENELAIAREVQRQLFPQALPDMVGLELGAICQAARIVSGDYYDCMQFDETHVAMVVADISGKGISAALLMANLSAALRSLVLSNDPIELDTGALAARLNRHLLRNTSEERYATLFFAVYDASSHILRYTNAGHLPPFFITDNHVEKLDRGGTVIGLLDHCAYQEASIEVRPGSLLVVYSDGMTEPENAQGEQFGSERLIGEVLRHRDDLPQKICGELIEAVRSWCAPAEPFDDQTVLVARMD